MQLLESAIPLKAITIHMYFHYFCRACSPRAGDFPPPSFTPPHTPPHSPPSHDLTLTPAKGSGNMENKIEVPAINFITATPTPSIGDKGQSPDPDRTTNNNNIRNTAPSGAVKVSQSRLSAEISDKSRKTSLSETS